MEKINFDWALNKSKLERAVKASKAFGKENDEEYVRGQYLMIGGLVADAPMPTRRRVESQIKIDNSDEENEEKPLSPMAKAVLRRKARSTVLPAMPDDNIPNVKIEGQ